MRKLLRSGCLLAAALAGLALLTRLWASWASSKASVYPPPLNRVAAWMPTSWDEERARASWDAHSDHVQELGPVWYQLGAGGDGSITPYSGARDTALMEEARANDVLLVPLVNNAYGGTFDPAPVSAVIHNPTLRSAHVAAVVDEVVAQGYDGIDVDYESLDGLQDREPFSLFVEELAAALHAENKLLSVTVHPKSSEPGTWSGPQAQDWARIGAAADRIRVMTYGVHWRDSPPGPIAPLYWMEDVTAFATSVVSPNKVYLGIHFYGLDWGNGPANALTWETAEALRAAQGSSRQWAGTDAAGRAVAEPWFAYTVGSTRHEVWYTDGASVAPRLRLVGRYGLGGIAVWRLGGEDPQAWSAIAAVLHSSLRLYLPLLESYP